MALLRRLAEQFRKPEGLAGRVLVFFLERGNRPANEWTLGLLGIGPTDHVLEVGFGHGGALERVLELAPGGRVTGVDFSETMVRQARRRLAAPIESGRASLFLGDLSALPAGPTFDRAFAVNVLYFVPDPKGFARALYDRLRPGGRAALFIRPEAELRRMRFPATGVFQFFSPSEAEDLLREAGFARAWTQTTTVAGGTGHCVLGER